MTTNAAPAGLRTRGWRHRGWRAAAALAVVGVAVTAVLGGFRKAETDRLPQLDAGRRIDAGALAVTPLRAWRTRTLPGRTPDPDSRDDYLVLRARIENRTRTGFSAYSYAQSDIVWLPADGGSEAAADALLRADDHSPYVAFPPRLPTVVDLAWKLPAGARVPARATWGVYGRRFVEQTYLVRDTAWVQDAPSAKLALTVEDRRAPASAP